MKAERGAASKLYGGVLKTSAQWLMSSAARHSPAVLQLSLAASKSAPAAVRQAAERQSRRLAVPSFAGLSRPCTAKCIRCSSSELAALGWNAGLRDTSKSQCWEVNPTIAVHVRTDFYPQYPQWKVYGQHDVAWRWSSHADGGRLEILSASAP